MSIILILEGHDAIRVSLREWLSATFPESRFCEARNVEDAMALLSDQSPDVALVDFQLPGTNGIEAIRLIRALSPRTKVVLMTSHEAAEYRRSALTAGAFECLPMSQLRTRLVPLLREILAAPPV